MSPQAVNVLFVMPTISIPFHFLWHVNTGGKHNERSNYVTKLRQKYLTQDKRKQECNQVTPNIVGNIFIYKIDLLRL